MPGDQRPRQVCRTECYIYNVMQQSAQLCPNLMQSVPGYETIDQ